MHPQLARSPALVPLVLFQDGQDELLFELAHRLGVEDSTLMHLQDQSF